MKLNLNLILVLSILFAPFHSWAVPKKNAASKKEPVVIPPEYVLFEKAKKDSFLPKLSLAQIQSHQKELKNLDWSTSNKALEKELEDLYWVYEIKRGEKLSQQSNHAAALNAWIKGVNSLHHHKWIYVWTEATSAAFVKACKRDKKHKLKQETLDKCLYLAKKIVDGFPKGALETQTLKEWIGDPAFVEASADKSIEKYDRLFQSSEKIDKDEQAFAEVLDHYLNRREIDLYASVKKFTDAFPKSALRFRATFLMAEMQFTHSMKKEAETNYRILMEQIPFSYYAIVASERLEVSLLDRLKKDPFPLNADANAPGLNILEKESLSRLQNLVRGKKEEPVAMELEQFSRLQSYPTEFLLYLIRQANQCNQDLSGFRFATEILQRKGEIPFKNEFVEMIFPDRFPKEIETTAQLLQVDPLLIVSLMKQESGFRSGILSSSGAVGLMQLMPFTAIEVAKDLQLRTLRDPARNIEIGTKYLASLLNEKFNGNVVYALAGYNAGPHRVAKWRKDAKPEWGMQEFVEAIPFKETRDYVMSILRNRYWYQYRRGVPVKSVFEAWRSP